MNWSIQKKGLIFALAAPLFYALRVANLKSAPPIKIEQIIFFRYLIEFLVLTPFYFKLKTNLPSQKLPMYALRAGCAIISGFCSIYGVRHLTLADALLLENSMPLFIPLVLWLWLNEKISRTSWILLIIGFSSLAFLLKPQFDILKLASFASLATGLFSAILTVSIKKLSRTEPTITMYFHFSALGAIYSFCLCAYSWDGIPNITLNTTLPLIIHSLLAMLYQYFLIKAYSLIPAHIVGSFAYFGLLFSSLLGWFIWHEVLHIHQLIGGSILVISGLFMIFNYRVKSPIKTA